MAGHGQPPLKAASAPATPARHHATTGPGDSVTPLGPLQAYRPLTNPPSMVGPLKLSPTYMAYILNSPDPSTNEPSRTPFRPLTQMPQAELDLRGNRGVYDHFHTPWNTHNRFLSSFNKPDLAACRDIARMPPPPWDASGRSSIRPSSAAGHWEGAGPTTPPPRRPASASPTKKQLVRQRIREMEAAAAMERMMVTQTGAPCFTAAALIPADLQACCPLDSPLPGPEMWRESRVMTYALPHARAGWGEGGVRPFHQDYRHYKYYGFAGKGGRTSWAHNPKHKEMYNQIIQSAVDANPPHVLTGNGEALPLDDSIGGVRRPLTPTEQQLVAQFGEHTYPAELPLSPRAPEQPIQRSPQHAASPKRPPKEKPNWMKPYEKPKYTMKLNKVEVMEPYMEKVDLCTNRPVHDARSSSVAVRTAAAAKAAAVGHGHPAAADPGAAAAGGQAPAGSAPGHHYPPSSPTAHTAGAAGSHWQHTATSPDGTTHVAHHTQYVHSGCPNGTANVATYRQYVGSVLTLVENTSPNHGSQSPFHQRYAHYKMYGFNGRGATSSYARNPKHALLYDH